MKELRIISSILLSINNELSKVFNSCNSREIQDSVRDARLNLTQSSCALEYAYRCSISKGSHEPNLPSISGESMASKQPVHGKG